jgi:hypothetical protein
MLPLKCPHREDLLREEEKKPPCVSGRHTAGPGEKGRRPRQSPHLGETGAAGLGPAERERLSRSS